jgi:hypothetical protein
MAQARSLEDLGPGRKPPRLAEPRRAADGFRHIGYRRRALVQMLMGIEPRVVMETRALSPGVPPDRPDYAVPRIAGVRLPWLLL